MVKLLIDSSNQQPLCVVSIVGIAGLGKTTLAKLVRNNDQIQGHFSNIMWICVSDNFDVMRILVQMLESLSKGHCENITSRDVIVQKIKEKLEEKNYLLILDDVWNEERPKWEDLRQCLSGISKKNGSRVLVTTRIQNVASVMGVLPEHVHCPNQLKDDDCWSVIRHRVFGNSSIPSELEELETIGRENAKKCKGVPLVASVIGGILCNNRNKDAWCEVWGSIKEADGVLPVLQLSFSRLPKPALKQCFAFCSIFPKDFVMEKEMLIQLWMAHGFLQPSGGKEMEDIGDDYFNDLLSSSLFQDAKTDSYRSVITCKMHDLIHDLAQSVSEPETMILGNGSQGNITVATRHLNLVSDEGMAAVEIGDAMQKLHTLLSKTDVFHDMPANLKKVRVLSLCGANIDKLPAVLRKLKHLRYLDVSKTKIKKFPKFITKLYQLQTLRFMDCHSIVRPLEGIGNLVNLRHLYFSSENLMPAGVGTLACLQMLTLFVVGQQKGCQIEELGGLSQLKGKLEITNLKMVRNREEAIMAKLSEKTAIQKLALDFNRIINELFLGRQSSLAQVYSPECRSEERRKHDEDVLEGLQPHSNLKSLRISNYCGEKCPSWMLGDLGNLGESTHLKNLLSLRLYHFHQLKIIPSLSLSNLVELIICGLDELESVSPLSLSSGAKVQIRRCKNLKSIADSRLQELIIDECNELISIGFGTLATMSLKEICIRCCWKLESLPSLTELPYLRTLCLEACGKLRDIGDGLFASTCPNLEALTIRGCKNLMSMPSLDGLSSLQIINIADHGLKSIGESLSTSTSLKILFIGSCGTLESIPSLDGLSSLQSIVIAGHGLKSIRGSLSTCTSLKSLSIGPCDSLESVPSLDGFSSLQIIRIAGHGLKSIGGSLSTCTSLQSLSIGPCDSLESVPSLDGLSSLQSISIAGQGLESVPSLDGLSSLQSISIAGQGLKSIWGSLSTCTSLKSLSIGPCDSLESVPSLDGLSSLQSISIAGQGLKSIWGSLSTCTRLQSLSIGPCDSLESIPSLDGLSYLHSISIAGHGLKSIGGSLSTCKSLGSLSIGPCDNLELVPSLDGLSSLQIIYIKHCGLKSIGGSLSTCRNLKSLFIEYCSSLESIPSLDGLSFLQELTICGSKFLVYGPSVDKLYSLKIIISGCGQLKSIGESLSNSVCLKILSICECDSLESIPSLNRLSSLETLRIERCGGLTSLPNGLSSCTALETLKISFCNNLISISEDLRDLRSLVELEITWCGKLRNIRGLGEILGCLTRLRKLRFGGFSAEQEDIEEYPTQLEEFSLIGWEKLENLSCQIQHLTVLRKLSLWDFHGIEALPDWLGNLSSLQSLDIKFCESLRYVKAIRHLSNLKRLGIWSCPELRGRCAKESGSEWNNISHIPDISIDGKNISYK
ncbi:hypothetical protein SLEP1_g59194 [Rubroshorea leprosula]|uniref:NB-ARC domain-containing protein n=1 Tax=Rubroshorea leprosula TaxID=152421 RepID=A0AAV5MT61_9ROSI|nr:hypothetical protein SLEP1_g59194 [Rubroshorea leprosula]